MTAPDPRLDEIQAIPTDAVEAAAKAIFESRSRFKWGDVSELMGGAKEFTRKEALAALEAAHPVLLAELRKAREALARVEDVAARLNSDADNANEGAKYAAEMNDGASLRSFETERFAYQQAEHLIRAAVAAANGDGQ